MAIARRGRGTPRIVNRLLKRVRDYAEVHGDGHVDEETARLAMTRMEIDDEGLDSTDRKLLAAIIQKFASGPVGVAALAAVLAEEVETIEDVYEPFLLRLGFLDRTPQGRIATEARPPAPRRPRLRDPAAAPRRTRDAAAVGRPVAELTMEGSAPFGWALVVVGVIIVVVGLVFVTGGRIPILGHLPGDIVIQRDNVTIFVPLGSMLLISVVVSVVLGLLNRR